MEERHERKSGGNAFLGAVVIGCMWLVPVVACAQSGPAGPVTYIDKSQFDQMVQDGQLSVVNPDVLLNQRLQALAKYVKNRAIVDEFIDQHPNLPNVARLAAAVPDNPNVFPTVNGGYRTTLVDRQGVPRTIETMGQGSVLTAMASSIEASSNPAQQLAVYQTLYSQYSALYNQVCIPPVGTSVSAGNQAPAACANLPAPSAMTNPSALQNASLGAIQGALRSLGSLAPDIRRIVPLPGSGAVACAAEIGASTAADNINFGDQTDSMGCTTPSPGGILGNFNWPSKNLVSCVKDQGTRSACHIFAATSALEEMIAKNKGVYVNLSEQDFNEQEKLLWDPSFYGDSGDSAVDLQNAMTNHYKFAYENQWDYNPSWSQPYPPAYEYKDSCDHYPWPGIEPACSWSAPQAIEYCAITITGDVCGFLTTALSGSRSPYMSHGSMSIWNPSDAESSIMLIEASLALNDAIILPFNATNDFAYGVVGGYIPYDPADIADTKDYYGQHSVHIVGYISNSDLAANPATASAPPGAGGGYFIIKNSWGACFGDAGYYYMPAVYLASQALDVYLVND